MKMDKPLPGMDKRKSKAESLYLKKEQEPEEERGRRPRESGTVVYYDGPFFAQIPQELIRDPIIPHAAVRLWGIYHTYAQNTKDLKLNPLTFVSQETVAKDMGVHRNRVSYWTRYLEREGWLTVIRRGLNKSNVIILHGRRKKG